MHQKNLKKKKLKEEGGIWGEKKETLRGFLILAAFNFTSLIPVGFVAVVALSPLQNKHENGEGF